MREAYERFGLNARQIEIIARATPKRDYYVQSPKGARLFDLGLGPVALAFAAAGTPEDQATLDRVMAETEGEGFAETWLHEKGLAWAADLLGQWPGHPSAEQPQS
jgi:type IV secretion system protein VirB4